MIEKPIGKTIHKYIFGETDDNCRLLQQKWLEKCFHTPQRLQLAFTWPPVSTGECKNLLDALFKCQENAKK